VRTPGAQLPDALAVCEQEQVPSSSSRAVEPFRRVYFVYFVGAMILHTKYTVLYTLSAASDWLTTRYRHAMPDAGGGRGGPRRLARGEYATKCRSLSKRAQKQLYSRVSLGTFSLKSARDNILARG
jgi:hypothetical protein